MHLPYFIFFFRTKVISWSYFKFTMNYEKYCNLNNFTSGYECFIHIYLWLEICKSEVKFTKDPSGVLSSISNFHMLQPGKSVRLFRQSVRHMNTFMVFDKKTSFMSPWWECSSRTLPTGMFVWGNGEGGGDLVHTSLLLSPVSCCYNTVY